MSILTKLLDKLRDILKIVPKRIREYAEITQPIVDKIKQAVDSGVALTIVEIIPGEIDDTIRAKLSKLLTLLSDGLHGHLHEMPEYAQNAMYAKLGALLLADLDEWKEERETLYDLYQAILYSRRKAENAK